MSDPGSPSQSSPHQVFVSHVSEDTWVATQIARAVTSCGAKPFIAVSDVKSKADFLEEIRVALGEAAELVVLVTPKLLERPFYVFSELGVAWYRRIPITVVLYGPSKEEFQSDLRIPQYLRDHRAPLERGLVNMVQIHQINEIDGYFADLATRIAAHS